MIKRKLLGQHFLVSSTIAKSIVDMAGITSNDTVLEIGTGKGILTPLLCKNAGKVVSIEKDPELYRQAVKSMSDLSNLVLVQGDAFKKNLPFTVLVSNLPYSESRTAIEWLVQKKFRRAVLMVQKEFAQKIAGSERRAVSVLAGYCLEITPAMDVKNSNFSPPPQVDSQVLVITPKNTISQDLVHTVNKMFSFKRKTVRNIGKKMGLEIDSDKRLEEMSDGEIIEIAKRI